MNYYIAQAGGQKKGPFKKNELLAHELTSDMLVWRQGMSNWAKAGSLLELADLFAQRNVITLTSASSPLSNLQQEIEKSKREVEELRKRINKLDTDNLDIELRGSGDVEFDNVICDHIGVALVGSGDVEVKKVKTLQSMVELIGSGDIKMKFEDSGRVEARLMGSGDIALSGRVQSLREDVRGSGDLETSRLIVKE